MADRQFPFAKCRRHPYLGSYYDNFPLNVGDITVALPCVIGYTNGKKPDTYVQFVGMEHSVKRIEEATVLTTLEQVVACASLMGNLYSRHTRLFIQSIKS